MKNIFIEGMQGSGKTTLLKLLGERLEGYNMYLEGDISPVELAWCSYMTAEEYRQALDTFPDLKSELEKHTIKERDYYIIEYTRIITDTEGFHHYMGKYEIYNGIRSFSEFKKIIFSRLERFNGKGNLFECSFFQNIIEELILFYRKSEEEIIDFYREMFAVIKEKNFSLIYIYSEDIKDNLLEIKKERVDENGIEWWFPLMMRYLNESPYGEEHNFNDITDMVNHFKRRIKLEMRINEEVLGDYSVVLHAKSYNIDDVVKGL